MKKLFALTLTITILFLTSCARTNKVAGQFYGCIEATDQNGNADTYYQFRSYDCTVFWLLTADELGFVPNANKTYTLAYNDSGTTSENKPCNCDWEFHCECEVYDDILISVR